MSENVTKPQYLSPWLCPKCGRDCSGQQDQFKDSGEATGWFLTCACGCEFIHWENVTNAPYGVEVDGQTYEYPEGSVDNDVSRYVAEYQELEGLDDVDIVAKLKAEHDWTPETSEVLLELARQYGAFILRHALALAVALDIEDGSEGL